MVLASRTVSLASAFLISLQICRWVQRRLGLGLENLPSWDLFKMQMVVTQAGLFKARQCLSIIGNSNIIKA